MESVAGESGVAEGLARVFASAKTVTKKPTVAWICYMDHIS